MVQIGDFSNGPMGWICPKCGRVYSPNTSMCTFCGPTTQTAWTTTNDPDWTLATGDPNVYLKYNVDKETICKTEI